MNEVYYIDEVRRLQFGLSAGEFWESQEMEADWKSNREYVLL